MKRQTGDANKPFFQRLTDKWGFPDEFATKLVFFGLIWGVFAFGCLIFALAFRHN